MSPLERLARAKLKALTEQKEQGLLQDFAMSQTIKNLRRGTQDFKQQIQPEYARVQFQRGGALGRPRTARTFRGPIVGAGREHQVRGSILKGRMELRRKKEAEKRRRERYDQTVGGITGSKKEVNPFMKWTTEGYRDVPGVDTDTYDMERVTNKTKKKKKRLRKLISKSGVLRGAGPKQAVTGLASSTTVDLNPNRPMSFT